MEISNRFELLASLSDNENSQEEQLINGKQPTKQHWEIPEYVEKPIPYSSQVISRIEKFKSSKKVKSTRSSKKEEPIADIVTQHDENDQVPRKNHINYTRNI